MSSLQRSRYPLMPIQSELFPPDVPSAQNATSGAARPSPQWPAAQPSQASAPKPAGATPAPVWIRRFSLGVLVTFCLYIGLLLFCLPWTRLWIQNPYILAYPKLGHLLLRGATRGVISGIGLMDVWIGLTEVIYYRNARDDKAASQT